MFLRRRIELGALAAAALVGGAATAAALVGGAATAAAAAQASTHTSGQLTLDLRPIALRFFSNTGPIIGWPTKPLVPGDRVIGQGRILEDGRPAGYDNETCTVSFARDVLCQDILILDGQGDVQASWSFRWPASGTRGPASFDGIIDGGTGNFRAAHGWFHAQALPNGDLQIVAVINGDG